MILICRFRRPLATAQTNRFALRLARDSARRGNCAARGRLRVLDFGRTTFGPCLEGQRAAAHSRSQYLLNRSSGSAQPKVCPRNTLKTRTGEEGTLIFDCFVCLVGRKMILLPWLSSVEIHGGSGHRLLGWLENSHRQAGCPPAPQPRWLCSSRFRCGAAAPAIAKAAGRATGRQES